jgi:uncharacterized protein DUF1573
MSGRVQRAIHATALLALATLGGWAAASLVAHQCVADLRSTDDGEPIAVLDRLEHDFGQVDAGPALQTNFQLHNAGSRRLIVWQIKNSCECLQGTAPEIVLAPGETKPLVVQLDTTKGIGPLAMEVHYRTSDPARPDLTLAVRAEIKRP